MKPQHYPREPKTLGGHLKKRRCELGLYQRDVAAKLAVGASTYLIWENDKAEPKIRFLPRIMMWLGYDPFPAPATLGDRLIARRRALGLSRKRAAKVLGVDEGTLARWEKGIWRPMAAKREVIRRFLSGS